MRFRISELTRLVTCACSFCFTRKLRELKVVE